MDSQRQTHAPQGDFIPGEPFHTGVGNFFQLWAQIQRKGVCLHKGKPGGFAFYQGDTTKRHTPARAVKSGMSWTHAIKTRNSIPRFLMGEGVHVPGRGKKNSTHRSTIAVAGHLTGGAVPSSPQPGSELHAVATNIFSRPAWPHRKGPAGWRGLSCCSAGVIAAGLAPWPRQWHD